MIKNMRQLKLTDNPQTDKWATRALKSLLDVCMVNMFVVELEMYPTLISDMTSANELSSFKEFLQNDF